MLWTLYQTWRIKQFLLCLRRSPFLHTNHPPPVKPNCDGHRDHFGPTRVSPRCGHSCEDLDYYNYCTGGWISTNCTLRESGTQGCARPPTTSTTSSSADICQRELNRSCCCNSWLRGATINAKVHSMRRCFAGGWCNSMNRGKGLS